MPHDRNNNRMGAVIAADYLELGNMKYVATTANNNKIDLWDSNTYV